MPRRLWGEFVEEEKLSELDKTTHYTEKRVGLEALQHRLPSENEKKVSVRIKNPLVTQTIEVMQQTEMLQSLIDTYSNKSGSSNYLLNPCQMIPEVDFPPENAADFVTDDKFVKPIWFIPPLNTNFSRGVPQQYPQLTSQVCRALLRKAVSGQLRVAGFTDTADSAIVLFADAVEEFVRDFMQKIRDVHATDTQLEATNVIEVENLEKAYYLLTNSSLMQVHNCFKHNLVSRNRLEIVEFNGVFQEYDKLMKESQSMQKDEFQDSSFLNILEMPQSNEGPTNGSVITDIANGSAGVSGIYEVQTTSVLHMNIFKDTTKPGDLETMQEQHSRDGINTYTNPPSLLQAHE